MTTDLDIMLHLFIIDRYFKKATDLKMRYLMMDHKIYINETQLEQLEGKRVRPKKGMYILGLLGMGFTPKQIAEWLETTEANVSYHKNQDKENTYINTFIQIYRANNKNAAYADIRKKFGLHELE